MNKEEQKRILLLAGLTKDDAERHLRAGVNIYPDFCEHFDAYIKEQRFEEDFELEEIEEMRQLVKNQKPILDYYVAIDGEKVYYIQPCL